jgi:hypothetical protein
MIETSCVLPVAPLMSLISIRWPESEDPVEEAKSDDLVVPEYGRSTDLTVNTAH